MRNENGALRTRTRTIKKPNRYDNYVMQIKLNIWKLKREMLGVTQILKYVRYLIESQSLCNQQLELCENYKINK